MKYNTKGQPCNSYCNKKNSCAELTLHRYTDLSEILFL
jgi:hypothetical protein